MPLHPAGADGGTGNVTTQTPLHYCSRSRRARRAGGGGDVFSGSYLFVVGGGKLRTFRSPADLSPSAGREQTGWAWIFCAIRTRVRA